MVGKKIPVVVGAEELMYYGLVAGGRGATDSIANYTPDVMGDLIHAQEQGNHAKARSLYFDYVVPLRHMDTPCGNARYADSDRANKGDDEFAGNGGRSGQTALGSTV